MKFASNHEAREYLAARIAKLEKELAELPSFTEADFAEKDEFYRDIMKIKNAPSKEYLERMSLIGDVHWKQESLERFKKTQAGKLMVVTRKYLAVPAETKAVESPAGFPHNSNVFTLIPGSRGMDRLPRSSNMAFYDVEKIMAAD